MIRSARLSALSCVALLGVAASSTAEIKYEVSVKQSTDQPLLHVRITVPNRDGSVTLQMPRWAPGAYMYSESGRSVEAFAATDAQGDKLSFQHPNDSTWQIETHRGDVVADYDFPARESEEIIHYSGPRTYMYVADRKNESCRLQIDLPEGWTVRDGLDPVRGSDRVFTAPTYDVLADTPVTMGKFIEEVYMSHGKPHYIVLYGRDRKSINRENLRKICKFTSAAEGNFFGEVPYKRYVWHFNVNGNRDGGGGLEHLNGTEISLGTAVGTLAQSVITHEFFHLWNVKRIRSSVLGPFDYTTLPKTGALWWLEGVTDYYAIMIPSKYGWWDLKQLEYFLARNISDTEGNPGRMQVSPYDSSYKVGEASGGRGNSRGLSISYYNTGWLLGLMFDVELRTRTHGKYSLDDVELGLWNECKNNQPGFPEDGIRTQLVRLGGPEMGDLYDKWVMQPGVLPVEDELAKMGLKYSFNETRIATLPFRRGRGAFNNNAGMAVQDDDGNPLGTITEINGTTLSAGSAGEVTQKVNGILAKFKPGDTVSVTIVTPGSNGGEAKTETRAVKLTGTTRRQGTVTEDPSATPEQMALRKAWMSPRPGTKAVFDAPSAPRPS